MTNDILDNGEHPAVLSAIMKQQCTERGRIVLNEAMDIHAGASICLGYSNFLEKFYRSAPIGITVEGSNTLTRSSSLYLVKVSTRVSTYFFRFGCHLG